MALFGSLAVLISLLVATPAPQDKAQGPDHPDELVFVPDLCGQAEGAPPRSSLGKLVLLTDLKKDDPFFGMVELLKKAKKPAAIIEFPEGKIAQARVELLQHLPEFVIIATRPDHIDVNQHFELLEMAATLDADPFVDFAFGYVTGATPAEASAFVERFLKVGKKKNSLPKSVADFGPSANGSSSFSGPASHPLAKGWKISRGFHGSVDEIVNRKKMLEGAGFVHAGGHGMPTGIADGLSGTDLRREQIDFSPGLYFSGPCYCGVTSTWFDTSTGKVQKVQVAPMESFALAVIASGATALFAGLDPDRGETCSQEMEHLWIHGDSLGHATKETYDGAVVALRRTPFELFRYEEGKRRPQKSLVYTMVGGGSSRALFGDPTMTPAKAAAPPPLELKIQDRKKALEILWESQAGPTKYWMASDVYRCGGGWTHRIAFREEIDVDTARELHGFEVAELSADGKPLPGQFATAMVERWGGKAYLHVYVVFPPKGQQNTFYVHRDFRARFRFPKS